MFTEDHYAQIREGSKASAEAVMPIISDVIAGEPERICDWGGGEGWWASVAAKRFDGEGFSFDVSVPETTAPRVTYYLTSEPIEDHAFDLTFCLEVGEHVPEIESQALIQQLCRITDGPIVWSAAIPGQQGHGHVNCQWPAYWHALFAYYGWSTYNPWLADVSELRFDVWDDQRIEPWYRQSLQVYWPDQADVPAPLALVHPEIWAWKL
jgi:hypothetical protein